MVLMNDHRLSKIQNILLFTFHESSFLELINRRHQSSSFLLQLLNLIQEVGTDNQLSRKLRANYLLSRLDQALQHQVDRDLHYITLKIRLLIYFRVNTRGVISKRPKLVNPLHYFCKGVLYS